MQALTLYSCSIALTIAAGYTNARLTKFDQRMDIFNEVKLIVLMYHVVLFTAFVPEPKTKFIIGYSACAAISIGLVVNMTMMVVQPVRLLKKTCKVKYALKKSEEA